MLNRITTSLKHIIGNSEATVEESLELTANCTCKMSSKRLLGSAKVKTLEIMNSRNGRFAI